MHRYIARRVPIPGELRVVGCMKRSVMVLMVVAACDPAEEALPDAASVAVDAAAAVDAVAVDAPEGLACLGMVPIATAPDPMVVEGMVLGVVGYQVSPADAARVELRRRGDGAVIATADTAIDGRFAMTVATGGVALDAWFVVEAAGRLPTHASPGEPLHGGESAFLLVADATEVAAWYRDAGATYAAGMRTMIASVKDCENDSPGGVTVDVAPAAGAVVYYDDEAQRWDPVLPAATNGFALAADAAASFELTARIGGLALPPRTVAAAPAALTLVLAGPRAP